MAATLTVVIVVPDSVAMVNDQILNVETSDNTSDPNTISRLARYIDGIADGAFGVTSVDIDVA